MHLKAIEAADETIKLAPDWAAPYYLRGEALYKLKQAPKAQTSFDKAIELGSRDEILLSNIYVARAANFMARMNNRSAILDLDKAIELNEDNVYAYNARAMILLDSGQIDLSEKDSAKACELDRSLC